MEQYEGDDVKKGKPKWLWWAIIGVVVVVVVVVMVTQLGGGESPSASGLTLDDLSAIVNQQSTLVQGLTQWKATTTEDLANLNTKQQQILSQLSGITSPKDWTQDFAALGADITDLRTDFGVLGDAWTSVNETISDAIAGINMTIPRYAMVSGMEEKLTGIYINVSVYGQGDYPIIVSLYGDKLDKAIVTPRPLTGYAIAKQYLYGLYSLDKSSNQTAVASVNLVPHVVGVAMTYELQGNNATGYVLVGSPSRNITEYNVMGLGVPIPNYTLSFDCVQRVVVIEPSGSWGAMDLIELKVTGTGVVVSYAAASSGESWVKAEEEW